MFSLPALGIVLEGLGKDPVLLEISRVSYERRHQAVVKAELVHHGVRRLLMLHGAGRRLHAAGGLRPGRLEGIERRHLGLLLVRGAHDHLATAI